MRIGANKRPFYRVVAVDERRKRTGGYLELLGTYNPLTSPKEINLKQDRIDDWIKKGAQPSDGFLRIIGKAPQRLPRKPKREKKEEPKAEAIPVKSDETGSDQSVSEPEAPVESVTEEAGPVEENAQAEAPKEEAESDSTSQAPLNDEEKTAEPTSEEAVKSKA